MAKQPKKKGFKRFFLGLLIFAVVFSCLAVWGLTEFWSFIEAYELSRPKNTIDPYVQQLTKEQIAAKDSVLLGQIDLNIQSEDACRQFILDSLTEDITYAQNISASDDTKLVYMLLHSGKPIGKVTLRPEETDKYGFTPWAVSDTSFDFSYLLGSKATITVPHDFTVYANGTALDSSYITQDNIPYELLKNYYKDYTFKLERNGFEIVTFVKDEPKAAFIDGYRVTVSGVLTTESGAEKTFSHEYTALAAATAYNMVFDVAGTGSGAVTITFNNTVETVELGDVELND